MTYKDAWEELKELLNGYNSDPLLRIIITKPLLKIIQRRMESIESQIEPPKPDEDF